jgi:hypothetical protein
MELWKTGLKPVTNVIQIDHHVELIFHEQVGYRTYNSLLQKPGNARRFC